MATCPQSSNQSLQTKRRTLRSNSKHPCHSNHPTHPVNNQNVFNQIKFEIEHQQANNATKTSFPVHDDPKSFQLVILPLQSPSASVHNLQIQNDSFRSANKNLPVHKPCQSILLMSPISSEDRLKPFDGLQKKETYLETPRAKSTSKAFKMTQSSPYDSKRRSYRKIRKDSARFVPFRKCQDQLENRIVSLINKIVQNKHNDKQVQFFCDKLMRISLKDIYNPYVISGIQATLNLLSQKSLQPCINSLLRLRKQVQNLSQKIWCELGNINGYEDVADVKKSVDLDVSREKITRKIYKMLIQQRKCEPTVARTRSLQVCDSFFKCNHQTPQEDLIDFFKEQKFLSL